MEALALTVAIAAIAGLGAVLRFGLDGAVQRSRLAEFPAGTLTVNLTGALAVGVLVGGGVEGDALLLAATAGVGSYTTFSTWVLETQRLAEEGAVPPAGLNLALSLAAGIAVAALGRELGGLL